ncbi:MAG: ABC transporter substrate-binding protein [Desulfobacteraceae bacterium]|nr:ABC transporter substrate-binding protein [Desulfobacteraceae bacterium]
MKKVLLFIVFIITLFSISYYFFLLKDKVKKEAINIALVGPISGSSSENGQEMLRGVNLFLDKIDGNFRATPIKLHIFDDRNKQTAINIATQIADQNKMLIVLGHYGSDNSVSAGIVYSKAGIPAVTASATAESVTLENDWYFKVIPDNGFTSEFIADYMKKALKRKKASIVSTASEYSTSLVQTFEPRAGKIGIHIKNTWNYDNETKHSERNLKNIAGQLRSEDDLGIIFFATGSEIGAKFFTLLRYPGTDYPVIGSDSFSTPSYISLFNYYSHERESPGYYSDGVYTVCPFIDGTADKQGKDFSREFVRKYDRKPSWIAASYYDAMLVVFKALERAEVMGEDIRKDRRKMRDALASFDSREIAIEGVTADIYFDENGNSVSGTPNVGIWQKQNLVPAFRQYQDISDADKPLPVKDTWPDNGAENQEITEEQALTDDNTIIIGNRILTGYRVVYTGIDINRIYNFNLKKGTFTADFYLWFRFQGEFEDTNIIFTNNVNQVVKRGERFAEYRAENDVTIRSYRVIADFKGDFNAQAFPFDQQVLRISLRHANQEKKELVFVPDAAGFSQAEEKKSFGDKVMRYVMKYVVKYVSGPIDKQTETYSSQPVFRKKHLEEKMVRPMEGWDVGNILLLQDIAEVPEQKLSFSQIHAQVNIRRKNMHSLFVKTFFPIIIIIVILYAGYFIPPDQLFIRMWILISGPAAIGLMHLLYLNPAYRILKYAFITIYILAGISVFISVLTSVIHRRGYPDAARFLTRIGKTAHIFLGLAAGIYIAYLYQG